MAKVKAAVLQMTSSSDVQASVADAVKLCEAAVAQGAQLILLPEGFAYLGPDQDRAAIAESLEASGPILSQMQAFAKQAKVELILGGFPENSDVEGKTYNTSVYLNAQGEVAALYRKVHLFDVALADGLTLQESATTVAGSQVVVAQTSLGPTGFAICYDLRFPELFRAQVEQGAQILTVPSAFTQTTGQDHWEVLLRARAVESQAYVLAAAQVGEHFEGRISYGHAMIVDPWGKILDEVESGTGIAVAEIDTAEVDRIREQLPSLKHRVLRG